MLIREASAAPEIDNASFIGTGLAPSTSPCTARRAQMNCNRTFSHSDLDTHALSIGAPAVHLLVKSTARQYLSGS